MLDRLVNVAADGAIAPPMVLFPYKRVPPYIKASVPSWWGLGNTDSGWMSMEAFYEYVTNVFFPWLLQQKITLPVVLFLDGHTSHNFIATYYVLQGTRNNIGCITTKRNSHVAAFRCCRF